MSEILAEKARRLEQDIAAAQRDVARRQENIERQRAELADVLFQQYITTTAWTRP